MKWFQRKDKLPPIPELMSSHYELHDLLGDLVDMWANHDYWAQPLMLPESRAKVEHEFDLMDSATLAELKAILWTLNSVLDEYQE